MLHMLILKPVPDLVAPGPTGLQHFTMHTTYTPTPWGAPGIIDCTSEATLSYLTLAVILHVWSLTHTSAAMSQPSLQNSETYLPINGQPGQFVTTTLFAPDVAETPAKPHFTLITHHLLAHHHPAVPPTLSLETETTPAVELPPKPHNGLLPHCTLHLMCTTSSNKVISARSTHLMPFLVTTCSADRTW